MEKVENANIPKIEIICGTIQQQALAEAVGYGIEEEGLHSHIRVGETVLLDAYELSQSTGLGVSVGIYQESIAVFSRLLKEKRPLFEYKVTELEVAKTIGKNAARLIKNKPFIDIDDQYIL